MDLRAELNKITIKINNTIKYKGHLLNLTIIDYTKNIIGILNDWKICLSFMGKNKIFQDIYIVEIIFCLLSDYKYVHNINNKEVPLHLYNPILNELTNLAVVNEKRNFKFKLYNISNSLIIFDFTQDNYKIYKLYNLNSIKEYYEKKQINIDHLVKELQLKPILEGNLNNLDTDYKKLSYINYNKNMIYEMKYNCIMDYHKLNLKIDKKIEKELV